MSAGLKLVLAKVSKELELHRIEANIQPGNTQSIQLVKRDQIFIDEDLLKFEN